MLVDAVSKGGNMLLNVGPTARGEFDDRALQTLKEIGTWMRRHSRSIYGCGRSEFVPPFDCRYTYDAERGRLYLHLFTCPFGRVELPGLRGKVEYAQFLNDASEVRVVEHERSSLPQGWTDPDPTMLMLQLSVQRPPVAVPVIALFLKG